jgi:hypothetical protein
MTRTIAILITLLMPCTVYAQLMLERVPNSQSDARVRVETKIPAALNGNVSLRFELLDIYFDGGSHGAFFKRENGSELVLFFPHPGYWSPQAKRDSKQPVAIQVKTLVEIVPDSPLQTRILELLANDIADGKRDRDATLKLIRIRDCILHRKPLAEIMELYNPATWEARPEKFGFGNDDPFDNANHGEHIKD